MSDIWIALLQLRLYQNCLKYEAGLTHEDSDLKVFHAVIAYDHV